MDNTTRIYVAYSLWKEEMRPEDIGAGVGKDRSTVYRWVKHFRIRGIRRTVKEYANAKTGRRRTKFRIENVNTF